MQTNFILEEVTTPIHEKTFLQFAVNLYKREKHWIRPLDNDIKDIFDPSKNKLFRNGEAIRWMLKDDTGKYIGRIAAFIDKKTAKTSEQPTGGVGFFECINNQEAANTLFDAAKTWLQERNMEAMDGPINFGDRDKWWGCLVDGFEHEPNYCMPYNLGYYKDLFESYGFKNYFNQYTFYKKVEPQGLSPIMERKAQRVFENPHYTFEHIRKKDMEKFVEDFRIIYNQAWARYRGVKEITKMHARALMKSIGPILDEKIMWFGYYDGEPIAFFLMIPEINDIVKHLNGKMNLLGKLKFLFYQKTGACNTALGLIFGIIPKHQGKGVEGGLVYSFAGEALKNSFPYKHLELNWIGDFNPTMIKVAEQIGGTPIKTHVTFRYLFDRNKPFTRAKKVS